jgi:hypothetical protein
MVMIARWVLVLLAMLALSVLHAAKCDGSKHPIIIVPGEWKLASYRLKVMYDL